MKTSFRDVTLAVRLLSKQPAFVTIAILTLGLGIGGSTAIFSVIDAALLRPLPYTNPEQLVLIQVEQRQEDGRLVRIAPSVEDMRDWERLGHLFSHVAIWRRTPWVVIDGPEPQRVSVHAATSAYLDMHGVAPILGRGITRDDEREGAPPVVLIAHGFWQSRFAGDSDVIGRTIVIDNARATIVGVLPRGFYEDSPVWRPFRETGARFTRRGSGAPTYARLQPGITRLQAQQELERLTFNLDRERGRSASAAIRVESLHDMVTRGQRDTVHILAGAVGLILLIACVNVAGLQLARATVRRSELAVRAAMGAGRSRLFRQLLTENLVLATAGGVVGLLIAWTTLDALVATLPISLPTNSAAALNLRVLTFCALLSMTTGTLFGLAPALTLSRTNVTHALARADRRHGSALSRRTSQLLITFEVALALVLLAGAGLMIRSFARILAVDIGFKPQSIVTMEAVPLDASQAGLRQYYPSLVRSIRDLPSVEAVGAIDFLPLGGSYRRMDLEIGGQHAELDIRQFLPAYFEAIGMPLKQGRLPRQSDLSAAVPAAVLNETAARQLFPGVPATGRRFDVRTTTFEVVGVVGDVRHSGPLEPVVPEGYLSFGYIDVRPLIVVIRANIPMPALTEQLRQTAQATGMRAGVYRVRRGSDWFADRIREPRRDTVLFGLLGGLGLLLAFVGVFGITAFAVGRRTQEIGIRIACGARPVDVAITMLRDAAWPVCIGLVAGLAGAALTTRVIATFLFDTPPTDPVTFAAVALFLGCAACAAAYIPARRAARVDPVAALRAG